MTISIDSVLPAHNQLPDTYVISLAEFGAISLTGEEKSKYLQGQVTCDVNNSNSSTLMHGAHCDAKGKVISAFRLINRLDAHLLLQPKSSISSSLEQLQKFGVFAKVTINEVNNLEFFALIGEQSSSLLQQHFGQVPDSLTPVIQVNSTTLIYLAGQKERYLLIDEANHIHQTIESLKLTVFSSSLWNQLEIAEGFPLLAKHACMEFVPQMLNLQAINGISFTKGCYLGQETVARMQYLGKNKRAMFSLEGHFNTAVNLGDILEKRIGDNWRRAGEVLAYYQADNGETYIQAVLASDIETDAVLRIKNAEQALLSIIALPYSLTQDN